MVSLEVADGVHIEQIALGEPSSSPGEEDSPLGVAARVARALAQPNQFLPLAEMVVPGDTATIDSGCGRPSSSAIATVSPGTTISASGKN